VVEMVQTLFYLLSHLLAAEAAAEIIHLVALVDLVVALDR